jgi:TRAP-type C4-dicarboxylate transport system permease small subunit
MVENLLKGVRALLAFVRAVAGILLICSIAINFANIIGRYFFSVSISWAEEVMLFLTVGTVFLGSCDVAWSGRQIRMDVVIGILPPRFRAALELLAELTFIATAILIAVFAWPVIRDLAAFDERSQAANFPLVIPQAAIPIGFTLMALLVAIRLATHRRPRDGHSGGTVRS